MRAELVNRVTQLRYAVARGRGASRPRSASDCIGPRPTADILLAVRSSEPPVKQQLATLAALALFAQVARVHIERRRRRQTMPRTKELTPGLAQSAELVRAWPNQTEASRLLGVEPSTLLRRDLPFE